MSGFLYKVELFPSNTRVVFFLVKLFDPPEIYLSDENGLRL